MQQKKKICKSCSKETYIFSKGECLNCSRKRYVSKRSEDRKERRQFFKVGVGKSDYCVETGAYIQSLSSGNLCHILPKRSYKSVETDVNNIIILTLEQHHKLDRYLDSIDLQGLKENMPKSYEFIKSKFADLKEKVTETSGKLYNEMVKEFS